MQTPAAPHIPVAMNSRFRNQEQFCRRLNNMSNYFTLNDWSSLLTSFVGLFVQFGVR